MSNSSHPEGSSLLRKALPIADEVGEGLRGGEAIPSMVLSSNAGVDMDKVGGCGQCPSKLDLGKSDLGKTDAAKAGSKIGCSKKDLDPAFVAGSLSTGDLAKQCKTTLRTVRFYDEEGLIEPVSRSDGGHRLYRPEQMERLQLIIELRESGLSLSSIRALFELKDSCSSAAEASTKMGELLCGQIEELQQKIVTLRRLREDLAQMVSILRECEGCESPTFREDCGSCDVMGRPDLPRAMRLLWGE